MGYAQLAVAAYGAYQAYKNKPSDDALRMAQAAMAQLQSVPVPDPATLKVQMQQLVQQGVVSPEDAQAIVVQHNAYDEANGSDPARAAQLSALQGFQDQANAGGLTDTSRAAIQANLDTTANTERGQNVAITEDARRRGVSGSGLELAQKLISQQSGADQAGRRGMDIAALAEQAKVEALKNAANTGQSIENQTFGEQATKAAAANQIAQYNATNQQQVTLQNIAARNAAQAANLAEKQRVADTNASNENTNRVRNSDLIQQNYVNNLDKAKAVSAAATGGAQAASNYDASKRAYNGDLTSGILKTVGDFGQALPRTVAPQPMPSQPMDTTSNAYLTNEAKQRKATLGYAHGGKVLPCYDDGGKVQGDTPQYPGDDSRNDTVLAKLTPGEEVIPRTKVDEMEGNGINVDSLLNDAPRTAQKPSVDAVKTLLQALTEMGC